MNRCIRCYNRSAVVIAAVLIAMLCVYGGAIVRINLSGNPALYYTDMYSDMVLAAEIWEHQSFFPEGWVFGNQVYTVATPVIAAVFYGLTENHLLAMGIASSLMGILVLLSFDWMLKPIVGEITSRLLGSVSFLSVVLLFGDAVDTVNGWQLFFTMCSYYACYAMNTFLAFGCYLRSESIFSGKTLWVVLLTCILSFGTGIQSVRQTAVMCAPLIGMELLCMGLRLLRKGRLMTKGTLVATVITVSNLAGVVLFRLLDVKQVEVFGQIELIDVTGLISGLLEAIKNIYSLFSPLNYSICSEWFLIVLLSVFAMATYLIFRKITAETNLNALICYGLFVASIAVIFAVDLFTTMSVRNIYYFMLYPLIAVGMAYLFSRGGQKVRIAVMGVLIVVFLFSGTYRLPDVYRAGTNSECDGYDEVSAFLQEEGYSTIYTGWNVGEKIAIVSNFDVEVGFWGSSEKAFIPVKYLCNPEVFRANSGDCAYVFLGAEDMNIGLQIAEEKGLQLELLRHFPESDLYIFTSHVNIMELDLQG